MPDSIRSIASLFRLAGRDDNHCGWKPLVLMIQVQASV
jgi:hypothetical protein